MASLEQVRTSLLTEHFGFTPLDLLDDIVNVVNELAFQAVAGIEESLASANIAELGFSETLESVAKSELENGVVKLQTLLDAVIDKAFDQLEIYALRNFLNITNLKDEEGLEYWVRLDHYHGLEADDDHDDDGPIDQDALELLERKVHETEKLQLLFKAECARNEAILADLTPLATDSLSFLGRRLAAKGIADISSDADGHRLTQLAQYIQPRIAAIKASLEQARPYIASLPTPEVSDAALTREAYLQSQSVHAMARAGVPHDCVPKRGRSVTLDEVQALEAVAAGLRGP